jgi:hypothetical protein
VEGEFRVANSFEKGTAAHISLFLLTFVLTLSWGLPAIAQPCKGPNLTLSVVDTGGEVTRLTCAYIGSDLLYLLSCRTESGSDLQINLDRIRKISVLRDKKGKLAWDSESTYFLATVQLKDGNSRKLHISGFTVIGYSAWGKQSFEADKIKTVDFE